MTLPHPKQPRSQCGRILVAPESMKNEKVLELFLLACAEPIYIDARGIMEKRHVPVRRMCVAREAHDPDEHGDIHFHDHVAAVAHRQFSFFLVKRANASSSMCISSQRLSFGTHALTMRAGCLHNSVLTVACQRFGNLLWLSWPRVMKLPICLVFGALKQ